MTDRAFSNPQHDAARVFRAILSSMARPGHIFRFSPGIPAPPPFLPATAAVALTLCDFQTPVWLDPELKVSDVNRYLRFHTGAPIVDEPGAAAFAFVSAPLAMPVIGSFAQGTHEYPDRSATLVIQVESLSQKAGVRLSGPGLEFPVLLDASPLGSPFWRQMAENHGGFPMGVDVIFASPEAIASCPRSTTPKPMEPA